MEAVREVQVTAQIADIGVQVDRLEKALSTLGMRLEGVTRSEPMSASDDKPMTPQDHLVPLADTLRFQASQLRALGDLAESLIRRLEV